jgi:hypothetical protein
MKMAAMYFSLILHQYYENELSESRMPMKTFSVFNLAFRFNHRRLILVHSFEGGVKYFISVINMKISMLGLLVNVSNGLRMHAELKLSGNNDNNDENKSVTEADCLHRAMRAYHRDSTALIVN